MDQDPAPVTELLARAGAGDAAASAALLPLVYAELRSLAARVMDGERAEHTLQPTALVHEAWLRLFATQLPPLADRAHFARLAARAMRHVLVDHARARRREKRGGGAERRVLLDDVLDEVERSGSLDVIALHEALERLAAQDEQAARIVEVRFFGGLTIAEAAAALGVSTPTVERGWSVARLWLARELGEAERA
jgi:RNA polymerase sigma factor (TIGR02999 family)